jgi:hypothetical protein
MKPSNVPPPVPCRQVEPRTCAQTARNRHARRQRASVAPRWSPWLSEGFATKRSSIRLATSPRADTRFPAGRNRGGRANPCRAERRQVEALRSELGPRARHVAWADLAGIGSNPARIIPAWREFVDDHGDRDLRGIGEPIWADRSAAELMECQRHESLSNLAFNRADGFHLRGAHPRSDLQSASYSREAPTASALPRSGSLSQRARCATTRKRKRSSGHWGHEVDVGRGRQTELRLEAVGPCGLVGGIRREDTRTCDRSWSRTSIMRGPSALFAEVVP